MLRVAVHNDGRASFYVYDYALSRSWHWYTDEATRLGTSTADVQFWFDYRHNEDSSTDWIMALRDAGGGGSPYVLPWTGRGFEVDNNVLPMSANQHARPDDDFLDYYQLQKPPEQRRGYYLLALDELERDHPYFDQVRLLTVDHRPDVSVGVSPTGEILTYQTPGPPARAVNRLGLDVSSGLLASNDGLFYQGYPGDYVILDFGNMDLSMAAKLLIRADPPIKQSIHIETRSSTGDWTEVVSYIPRNQWSVVIIDLRRHLPDSFGMVMVRLVITDFHKIDYVGLDPTAEAPVDIRFARLASTIHSSLGDVTPLLAFSDDAYSDITPTEVIVLSFVATHQSYERRDFIVVIEGYYVPYRG